MKIFAQNFQSRNLELKVEEQIMQVKLDPKVGENYAVLDIMMTFVHPQRVDKVTFNVHGFPAFMKVKCSD